MSQKIFFLMLFFVLVLCGGCTRAELVSKSDAYDAAIWDANTKQILLNAVRASQRAPMSFVGFGDVTANPVFSGSTAGTFNFVPAGLTGYSVNPSVSYGGGFSSFQISNLNFKEFANAMHRPIDIRLREHFVFQKWPKEIRDRVLIQSITLTPSQYATIERQWEAKCRENIQRSIEFCRQIAADTRESADRGCPPRESLEFLNTGREFCKMNEFQILLRKMRLIRYESRVGAKLRSAEGILYFLGELIAAQNYSAQQYEPKVFTRGPDGHYYAVNLFVVRRGSPGPSVAAVQVNFNGEDFYIPKPVLGALDEDRSLMVLDLVATAIVLATVKEDLPKSNNVNLVVPR